MDDEINATLLVKKTHENAFETLREKNIKNLILIKTKEYDFYKLQNIIDYVILASEKQINLKNIYKQKKITVKEVRSYFLQECIKNNIIKQQEIPEMKKYSRKKKKLLECYYRISKNNYELLFIALDNFYMLKNQIL